MNSNSSHLPSPISHLQNGQTLIETMVAIFILVMGVTAAIGLAVYAFNSSTDITKQIIATGLAREGIEAVKNMRDTNWLRDSLATSCYDYSNSQNDADCYENWIGDSTNSITPYCVNPSTSSCNGSASSTVYSLGINPAVDYNNLAGNNSFWMLTPNPGSYALDFNPANSGNSGFYTPSSSANGSSGYYRKITITKNTNAPYNQNVGPELQLAVQVWWTDKQCPQTPTWPGLNKCSLEIDSNLTNWKDY